MDKIEEIKDLILDALDKRTLELRKELLLKLKHFIQEEINTVNLCITDAINDPDGSEDEIEILRKALRG